MSKITRLAFSPDGKRMASASDDTTVKISHLDSKEVDTLHGHGSPVTDLAFSPGGDVLATAGWDTTIRIWDAASRQEAASLISPARGSSSSVAYSPDGAFVAQGGAIRHDRPRRSHAPRPVDRIGGVVVLSRRQRHGESLSTARGNCRIRVR